MGTENGKNRDVTRTTSTDSTRPRKKTEEVCRILFVYPKKGPAGLIWMCIVAH